MATLEYKFYNFIWYVIHHKYLSIGTNVMPFGTIGCMQKCIYQRTQILAVFFVVWSVAFSTTSTGWITTVLKNLRFCEQLLTCVNIHLKKVYIIIFQSLMVIWYASLPIVFPMLLSGFIFYQYEFKKPAFWIALYSSLLKNIWGLYGATLITGMACGFGCKQGRTSWVMYEN